MNESKITSTVLCAVLALLVCLGATGQVHAEMVMTNLTAWLKADVGVETDGSGYVTRWNDQTVNDNDAVPGVSPMLETVDTPFGKPVVRFSGGQYLNLPNTSTLGMQNSDYEIFVVARSSSSDTQFLTAGGHGTYELHLNLHPNSVGARFIPDYPEAEFADIGLSGDFTTGLPHLFDVRVESDTGIIRVDGIESSDTTGNAQSSNDALLRLGLRTDGTLPFDGDIAEVLVYSAPLIPADRAQVEQYLTNRWIVVPEPSTFTSVRNGDWDTDPGDDPWDEGGAAPGAYNPVVVTGGFTVTVTGTGDVGKSLSITGGGNVEVQINTDKTLTITNTVDVDQGGILDVDGMLDAGGLVSVAGILTGDGSVVADVDMKKDLLAGILDPGSSVGTLGVDGDLTLFAGSRYDWEVGDGTLDLVEVDDVLTLDDGWILKIIDDGGSGAAGDYLLFTYDTLAGFEPDEVLYNLDDVGSLGWTTDMLSVIDVPGGSGSVYLHVVPEPSTLVLLFSGLLALLLFARRRKR